MSQLGVSQHGSVLSRVECDVGQVDPERPLCSGWAMGWAVAGNQSATHVVSTCPLLLPELQASKPVLLTGGVQGSYRLPVHPTNQGYLPSRVGPHGWQAQYGLNRS